MADLATVSQRSCGQYQYRCVFRGSLIEYRARPERNLSLLSEDSWHLKRVVLQQAWWRRLT